MEFKNNNELKKRNGIFYTPNELADFLTYSPPKRNHLHILDPSFGDGALLHAALKRLNKLGIRSSLFGCDLSPVIENHQLPRGSILKKMDFFDLEESNKFDFIIMNPPFIRHQNIEKAKLALYRSKLKKHFVIKGKSDLWVYFLIKSINLLDRNGQLAAVLPTAILQADYARQVREYLIDKFGYIKILKLGNGYFCGTEERVCLLWLKKFRKQHEHQKRIYLGFTEKITEKTKYSRLNIKNWISDKVVLTTNKQTAELIKSLRESYNYDRLSKYADIKIGIVTGANNYFIADENCVREFCFNKKDLYPILTKTSELCGFAVDGYTPYKKLIYIRDKHLAKVYSSYIKRGIKREINKRAHSKLRDPWYRVIVGEVPDAFIHYRVRSTPYIVLNSSRILNTNSIHRVFFRQLTENQIKWLQISMLTHMSQLSIELNARTYGNGVLKIEPGSLMNCLVVCDNSRISQTTYNKISTLLCNGRHDKASEKATDYIRSKFGIPKVKVKLAKSILDEIRRNRIGSNIK